MVDSFVYFIIFLCVEVCVVCIKKKVWGYGDNLVSRSIIIKIKGVNLSVRIYMVERGES